VCGRFVSTQSRYALSEYFNASFADGDDELPPSYNVAPSRQVYTVAGSRSGRRLGLMTWGLMASWTKAGATGRRPINARAESVATNGLFASALARRRCLVPADGFYEWRRHPGVRQPFFFASPTGRPLGLAALWDRWQGPDPADPPLLSFAVVTTAANATVGPLHDRMPALLEGLALDHWLDPSITDPDYLASLLVPAPPDWLTMREVDPRVNNANNDGPELLGITA